MNFKNSFLHNGKSMNALLGLAFLLLFNLGCSAQKPTQLIKNKNDHSLLWQISGNGLEQPSYLYGTFHLMCKEDIQLSKQLKEALKQSSAIYLEMDMDDPSTMLAGAMNMTMKGGKKLGDFYAPEDYQRLQKYFSDSLKIPAPFYEKMKPFFLAAMLYPKYLDCKNSSGIEQEIMALAKKNDKPIKGLETIQFQMSIVDSIPLEWQAKELLKGVDSMAFNKIQFKKMVSLYNSQNLDSMGILLTSSELGGDQYNDIFLKNRNLNWVKKLKEVMPKESLFIAVGAGHLIGEWGLIQLLKKEGYQVIPLENRKQE